MALLSAAPWSASAGIYKKRTGRDGKNQPAAENAAIRHR